MFTYPFRFLKILPQLDRTIEEAWYLNSQTNYFYSQGRHELCIWPDVEGDGSKNTKTPYKAPNASNQQMVRLAKLAKKHREGHMTKVDWLDRLTFRYVQIYYRSLLVDVAR